MTDGFQTVLAASEKERRDLFVGAADRLRTNEQNIEKDFWVCWTLDALFNELETGGGQRVSRHYYDVYRLLASETGRKATEDAEMAEDCVRHARMFFNRPDLDLASAVPGSFALTPHDGMLSDLRKDYEAMSGMVFGPIPTVDAVVATIAELEQRLNRGH